MASASPLDGLRLPLRVLQVLPASLPPAVELAPSADCCDEAPKLKHRRRAARKSDMSSCAAALGGVSRGVTLRSMTELLR